MTTGDSSHRQTTSGDRGLSNDDLRRRLIDRQDAHLRSQAEAGLTGRLTRWQEERQQPVTRLFVPRRARTSGLAALRQWPVLSYLAAVVLSGVIVAALAMLLADRGGQSLIAGADAPPQSAQTAPGGQDLAVATATSAGPDVAAEVLPQPADLEEPQPAAFTAQERAETEAPAAEAAVADDSKAEIGVRLRRTATDLPAVSPKDPPIDPVATALALRLPVDPTATGTVRREVSPSPSPANGGLPMPVEGGGIITIPPSVLPAVGQSPAPTAEPLASADAELQAPLPAEALAPSLPATEAEADALPQAAVTEPAPAVEPDTTPASEPAATADRTASAAGQSQGRITAAVNLRDAPDMSAKVLGVLPKGGAVAIHSCNDWCEVEATGKRGFVFKKFVERTEGG